MAFMAHANPYNTGLDRNAANYTPLTPLSLLARAAPPVPMIEGMEKIGFNITHAYGLTETYGPAALCAKHESWASLPLERRAELNGRQGEWYHAQ